MVVLRAAGDAGIALFLKSSGCSLALESFSLAVPLIRVRSPACDQVPLFPSHFLCFPRPLSSFQGYPQKHRIRLTLFCLEESPPTPAPAPAHGTSLQAPLSRP